jgi:hypothetical protein
MQVGEHCFWSWNAPNAGCRTFSSRLSPLARGADQIETKIRGILSRSRFEKKDNDGDPDF